MKKLTRTALIFVLALTMFGTINTFAATRNWHTHRYSTVVDKKQPTCTSAGYVKKKCSCGKTKTTYTAKRGHSWRTKRIRPTCTKSGYTIKTCSRCGRDESGVTLSDSPALGHSWQSKWIKTRTIHGRNVDKIEYSKRCNRCGITKSRTETHDAKHHLVYSRTVAPTKSRRGYDLYVCNKNGGCGLTEKRNYKAKKK